MRDKDIIASLKEEVADLREALFLMRESIKAETGVANIPNLTQTEYTILGFLAKRKRATKQQLLTILYSARRGETPAPKIIDVFMHRLRPKLASLGIEIRTQVGTGYVLPNDSLQRLNDIIRADAA